MPPLLHIEDLRVCFPGDPQPVIAVDGVSLSVGRGRTTALVGESGCGKSVTALSVLRLLPQPPARIESGQILFHQSRELNGDSACAVPSVDLLRLPDRGLRRIRGRHIAMVFQDPLGSLHPMYTIGEQIMEAVTLHLGMSRQAAREAAVEALHRVGIASPRRRLNDYAHQFSGGMQQRVMIAMALACRPSLLIADEPTTALDVSVQAQILDLLRSLQVESGLSILLITHDFGVVSELADDVYVMYAGRIVEHAPAAMLLGEPLHPYTEALLACTPRLDDDGGRFAYIPGGVPDPSCRPPGCAFHPRCTLSMERARASNRIMTRIDDAGRCVLTRCVRKFSEEPSGVPALRELRPSHFVACWER